MTAINIEEIVDRRSELTTRHDELVRIVQQGTVELQQVKGAIAALDEIIPLRVEEGVNSEEDG